VIGGYAERMLLSAPLLLRVPDGLDPRHAALTEPMAVGLHAVNKAAIQSGDTALVIGCGPIGIAIIAALRLRDVEHIVATDFSQTRRDLAVTMGAHEVLDPAQGSPFDSVTPVVVFEAVGVPGIINDVMRRAPMGSRLIVAGVCMEPDTVLPLFGTAKETTFSSSTPMTTMSSRSRCRASRTGGSTSRRRSPARSASTASARHSTSWPRRKHIAKSL
jgi:threonine dehydrogenase-like Zn-dependent dehydrogenase